MTLILPYVRLIQFGMMNLSSWCHLCPCHQTLELNRICIIRLLKNILNICFLAMALGMAMLVCFSTLLVHLYSIFNSRWKHNVLHRAWATTEVAATKTMYESHWLWWPPDFSSSTTTRSKFCFVHWNILMSIKWTGTISCTDISWSPENEF